MPGRFAYSAHARQRMGEREISERDVEDVVDGADETRRDRAGHPVYRATIRGRRIGVVLALDVTPPVVVTTYLVPGRGQ